MTREPSKMNIDMKRIFHSHANKTRFHKKGTVKLRKLSPPCMSPTKYKPPKSVAQKNPPLNRPSK